MHRPVIITALATLIIFSACRNGERDVAESEDGRLMIGQSEVEETSVRGVNPGTRTVVLSGFNGSILLSGSEDANARLEFTKRARGHDDADARSLLEEIDIDEAGGEDSYVFTMASSRPERSAVDVRGTLPTGTPLRIELESGVIELSALDGPFDISNQNGSIRVAGAGRPLSLQTLNGDIELGMRLVPTEGNVTLRSSNGDITLTLPSSASAQVDARTSTGDISTSGLSFSSRRLERQVAGARFSAQLGQGNASIDLQTENGSIFIREGRVLTLPAADTLVGTPSDAIEGDTSLDRTTAPPDTLMEVDEEAQDTSLLQQPPPQENP